MIITEDFRKIPKLNKMDNLNNFKFINKEDTFT